MSYRIALGAGWVLLAAAAWIYAAMKAIPPTAALPLAAAFLVEYSFYLLPGFPDLWRQWSQRIGRLGTVAFLPLSSVFPYLVYTLPPLLFPLPNPFFLPPTPL